MVLCGVSAIALMGSAAYAQENNGNVYVEIDGFISFLGTEKADGAVLQLQNKFKTGGGFAGIVGYDFGQIRLEGEIGKHYHLAETFTVTNDAGLGLTSGTAANGKSNATHYMINTIYDFDDGIGDTDFEPFVGAGLGLSSVAWNNFTAPGGGAPYTSGSDDVFTYQAFAGVRVPIASNVDLSLKYRYLGTSDADRLDSAGDAFRTSYNVHDVVVGITYKFGGKSNTQAAKAPQPVPVAMAQPAPEPVPDPTPVANIAPAAPAPMPEVDRGPYSIYFDWDSSYIGTDAREILRQAIIESEKVEQITILINGHADRSGPNGYNDSISFKRATAVKETLIANGVAADKIIIDGHGERMPLVPTDDGVKERQNRRVTIELN